MEEMVIRAKTKQLSERMVIRANTKQLSEENEREYQRKWSSEQTNEKESISGTERKGTSCSRLTSAPR